MTSRAVTAATATAVIISVLCFRVFLVLPFIAIPLAGLAGGIVVGLLVRPREWSDVATPGVVVATAATVAAMLSLAGAGGAPLEGRFVVGWLFCLLLGAAACSLAARALGALAPRGLR